MWLSPSTRRAWIEIFATSFTDFFIPVALHPEGVDRNYDVQSVVVEVYIVALHPEGVDRNCAAVIVKFRA